MTAITDGVRLWHHVLGDRPDLLQVFTGYRKTREKKTKLDMVSERYYAPSQIEEAAAWVAQQDSISRDVYFCAHQLLAQKRVKENASSVVCLWADVDHANLDDSPIRPTAVVASSPGHVHAYVRLSRPIAATRAEELNKRWAHAFGADGSGFDLTQLLRVPGTHNYGYAETPEVKLLEIDDETVYDPDELDRILPKLPEPKRSVSVAAAASLSDDDQELLALLLERSSAFAALWQGNVSSFADEHGVVDQSRVDWGVIRELLRATGRDADRTERLARLWPHQRSDGKWDSARGGETFLRYDIDRAIKHWDRDEVAGGGGSVPIRLTPSNGQVHALPLKPEDRAPWPQPENRGKATLSEQGNVEYVEDLVKPGRIVVWAAEEGSGKSYTVDGELSIRLVKAGGSLAGTWPIVGSHKVLVLSEMHPDDDFEREETVLGSFELTRAALDGMYWRLSLLTAAHGKPCLQEPDWCNWCVEWCRNNDVHVLVVDTATGATDVNPWGHDMQAVFRQLRLMLVAYPELAIILIVHCKKPQPGATGDRRITDVIGEWGRWCDVIVLQERDDLTHVKLTTFKRVRNMRKILATQEGGLLINPIQLDGSTKVPISVLMTTIAENPGITVTRLGELLGVSKRTALVYVRGAEEKGHIYAQIGKKNTKYLYVDPGDRASELP